ncbi:MAG: aldehyde ferredoxin oxidoreductase N-terminal domain-containing protein [Thermodesulfobacteriota bacterium]|nr:aldehyde ferredoxin oxidoreductase N-terminal domain-containing protein [Thermodesulfobacteriota bacterium]
MTPKGGWVGKILRVDLTTGKVSVTSTFDYVPKFLGGRGLGAKICWDEVPPEVGAFDPENRLILATGPLQGTLAPTSGRFTVLGKAPQTAPTESFCRSGVGGHFAPELKWAGFDALIIQGKAPKPVYLWISDQRAEILDATRLWGLDTYQAQQMIWKLHGWKTRVMVIGRAGENRSRIACILTDTGDASGQGGFGGVMGSKNLKAIAVRGTGSVPVARPKALMEITHHIHKLFARKPSHSDPYQPEEKNFKYNIWGGGYGRGSLSLLPGELLDLCQDPSSGYSQIPDGCFACPVSCRSRVKGPDITPGVAFCAQSYMYLESMVHQPEKGYSKITWQAAKLGDLLGINAYELMAIVPWLSDCYREKLITEEETGLPLNEIGSWNFASKLLHKIANREGLGDLLAEGGQRAAAKLGGKAEKLSFMYYPRAGNFGGYREHWVYLGGFPTGYAIPSLALMWVLDNRDALVSHSYIAMLWGAAFTIGQNALTAVPEKIFPALKTAMKVAYGSEEAAEFLHADGKNLNWKWAAPVVKRYHEHSLLKDSYILCDVLFPYLFNANSADHAGDPSLESRIYSAVTGIEMSLEESYGQGEMLCTLERALAVRDGRTRKDDILHDLYFEKEDAGGRKYIREDLERAKSEYYRLMGWDVNSGIPTAAILERLGLKEVTAGLQKRGLPEVKS